MWKKNGPNLGRNQKVPQHNSGEGKQIGQMGFGSKMHTEGAGFLTATKQHSRTYLHSEKKATLCTVKGKLSRRTQESKKKNQT